MKPNQLFENLLGAEIKTQKGQARRWLFWLSVALAVILLYLSLKDLDWVSFFYTLKDAQYGFLPCVLAWSSLSYLLRALRWRVLLEAEKPISIRESFFANMSGYLGNNILPLRAGEFVRAAYAKRIANISISFALSSGLSERLMDVCALILLGTLALSTSGITTGVIQQTLQAMTVTAGMGTIFLLALPVLRPLIEQIAAWVPFVPPQQKDKIFQTLEKLLDGFQALMHPKRAVSFGAYTVLIWLMDGLGTVFLAYVLRISLTLSQSFLLLAGLGLSSAIPSTPGYVGIYQFVAVTVLGSFQISSSAAVALILFAQVCNWLVIGGWGLAALLSISGSKRLVDQKPF